MTGGYNSTWPSGPDTTFFDTPMPETHSSTKHELSEASSILQLRERTVWPIPAPIPRRPFNSIVESAASSSASSARGVCGSQYRGASTMSSLHMSLVLSLSQQISTALSDGPTNET